LAAKNFSITSPSGMALLEPFDVLAHCRSRPDKPILNIWGVGGIGKTSLLKKAVEELGMDLAGLRLIFLDLDHDRWTPATPVAEFFWQMLGTSWQL